MSNYKTFHHMPPYEKVDLDNLERLHNEAFLGPWLHDGGSCGQVFHPSSVYRHVGDDEYYTFLKAPKGEDHAADVKLIATMRNALPDLIAELRDLRKKTETTS